MSRLQGKTAVITGASSGIGQGIASSFAREGAHVIVNYNKSEQSARKVVEEIRAKGGKASAIQADISSQDGINRLLAESQTILGAIDIWVNNAGADILTGANASADDQQKLENLIAVDLLGTMNCCWSVLPCMQARGTGTIINMSWDLAIHGFTGRNPQMFAAVKAGVLGFSKSLARTCAPEVRVNILAPGWIQTAFADDIMEKEYYQARIKEIPMQRFGLAEDVANAAVYLASDEATYLSGEVINVNGGLV
ncbi:MAG: SDR family oxidoreductase [Gammaproteobacteria bacterium]|nr:SDR family oxidoreductase [Gammaproteobacteria bacterium]